MIDSISANRLQYRKGDKGFYEVYFVEIQDGDGRSGLWVRYSICAPKKGEAVAQLWAMYFDRDDPSQKRALQTTIPISEAQLAADSFQIGASMITPSGCRGKIEQEGQSIEWDLNWKEDLVFVPFPYPWMYRAAFPKTKFYSPHWDARIDGHYSANGKKWICNQDCGQQTHIWGVEHAHRWAWCHVNTFENTPGVVVEALHAQIKIGPLHIRRFALFALRYQGQDFLFNEPAQLLSSTQSTFKPPTNAKDVYPPSAWTVQNETDKFRFRFSISGKIENYLGVTYHDTTGRELICNHNKLANATLEVSTKNGQGEWEIKEILPSKTGALEFVGPEADPRVPVLLR